MKLKPALVELVVADMAATLAFYRRLGLDVPAGADGEVHVDIDLRGGMPLGFDTEALICSIDPGGPSPHAATGPPWRSTAAPPSRWTPPRLSSRAPATKATSPHGTLSGACVTQLVHDPDGPVRSPTRLAHGATGRAWCWRGSAAGCVDPALRAGEAGVRGARTRRCEQTGRPGG